MPAGFFDLDDIPTVRGDEKISKPAAPKRLGCDDCGLKAACVTPHLPSFGKGTNGILVIVEHPTQDDDRRGKLLTGETGKLLRSWFAQAGVDLDECTVVSALECAPQEGESAGSMNYAACRRFLVRKVAQANPGAIILFGMGAVTGLLGDRMTGRLKGLSIDDWAGVQAPDQELKAWVCPTWSVNDFTRMGSDEVIQRQILDQIADVSNLATVDVPMYAWRERVVPITTPDEAVAVMASLRLKRSTIAYDYETTGLKPHREVQKLYTMSVSDGETAWAFPWDAFKDHAGFREAHRKLLTSPKVYVIAHNGKFDATWTAEKAGFWPNLDWDTMLAAHSIHNRKKVNLKFCVYCSFGVAGYDDSIDPYLQAVAAESERYGANALNQIERAPLGDVLLYNAADSLFTYWLEKEQQEQVSDHVLRGIRFFTEASIALAKSEQNGIRLNGGDAATAQATLGASMDKLVDEIMSQPEIEKWEKAGKGEFRPGAPEDIGVLLFDVLKLKSTAKTKKGNVSTDKAALEAFEHLPVVSLVLAWRKLQKMKDTYITGFIREAVNGYIHTSFHLLIDTFRSGSSDPNFQNVPKRDKKAAGPIRKLLKPHPGQRLCEYDYKAVEVCVSACYNKDPNLIKYITDPTTDMHRDVGMELFMRTKETLTKDERSVAKNGFVFPSFYGSYYEQTAPDLWHKMPAETKKHLASEGIETLSDFTLHVREIETDFWGTRFPVYAKWKKQEVKRYQAQGYLRGHTGFEYQGPMKRNEAINYPTQGSAFHCLLRTFTKMTAWLEENEMKTKIMGQIHDAMVISVEPSEQEAVDRQIWWIGTQEIRKAWPWIIVPLNIEKSMSEIDGDWSVMQDCGLLNEKGEWNEPE